MPHVPAPPQATRRQTPRLAHGPLGALPWLLAIASLGGCAMLNDTRALGDGARVQPPGPAGAVLIYGLGVEGPLQQKRLAVSLDEYDLRRQAITGNCWRFNRVSAAVPREPAGVQRFAFEVSPGHYAFSGFNALDHRDPHLRGPNTFAAPPGQAVHVGDFVLTAAGRLELRPATPATLSELERQFPALAGKIMPAVAVDAARAGIFLCAP